jgi:hypothetical protein
MVGDWKNFDILKATVMKTYTWTSVQASLFKMWNNELINSHKRGETHFKLEYIKISVVLFTFMHTWLAENFV